MKDLLNRRALSIIPMALLAACTINANVPVPDTRPIVTQAYLHETYHLDVSHDDSVPLAEPLQPVYRVPPRYPFEALKGCFGGVVVVELLISERGRVSRVDVLAADETNVFVDSVVKSV